MPFLPKVCTSHPRTFLLVMSKYKTGANSLCCRHFLVRKQQIDKNENLFQRPTGPDVIERQIQGRPQKPTAAPWTSEVVAGLSQRDTRKRLYLTPLPTRQKGLSMNNLNFLKGWSFPRFRAFETQVQVGPVSQLHQCLVPRRIQSNHLFADSSLHSGRPWSVFSTSCHPLTPSHHSGAK